MKTLMFLLFSVFSLSVSECGHKPCYEDREVTEKISQVALDYSSNGDLTLLLNPKDGSRYTVCNAELFELKDSSQYIVSGIVYAVKPNERWPGTPFEITDIKN